MTTISQTLQDIEAAEKQERFNKNRAYAVRINLMLLKALKEFTGKDFALDKDNLVMIEDRKFFMHEWVVCHYSSETRWKLTTIKPSLSKKYLFFGPLIQRDVWYEIDTREDFKRALSND